MTTRQLISPPSIEKVENGAPWLGSPIQRSMEGDCEYFDCDTDISGLGISLKQLKLDPPHAANETFSIENEEFVEPETDIDGDFSQMLKVALHTQELEFGKKFQEKDELIKTLKEAVEQQKLKTEESSTGKVTDYEKKLLDSFKELTDLGDKLKTTMEEKNQIKADFKELYQDVNLCEDAFSLLHKNYEKVKVILDNFNKNEQLLNTRYEQMRQLAERQDNKIQYIKMQTEEKMMMAKRDHDEKLKEVESEQTKLKAMICMNDVQIRQLKAGITQKTREVGQLRELCEELIKGKDC